MPSEPTFRQRNEQKVDADPSALALGAIAWTLGDADRAQRLLGLTGLDPVALRARIGDPSLQAAALAFLEANEADLLACAGALEVKPAALVQAREALER